MPRTNLGQYLYSARIRRGYSSTTDYLKDYASIPISESYYRDIETGRKIIRIETAENLCRGLKLDKREFYYQLLNDVLPTDVVKDLLKQVPVATFGDASEEFRRLNESISVLRSAYNKRLLEEPYIVNDETVEYLGGNFELLPLIHFIYMRNKCTFDELEDIAKRNNISRPLADILDEFEKRKIAVIKRRRKTVARYSKTFRIPRSRAGRAFKDRFLRREVERSTRAATKERTVGPSNTFIYAGIMCVRRGKALDRVSHRLTDLLAELEVEESSLDEEGATPYFATVIFSSREEYSIAEKEGRAGRRRGP